MTTDQIIQQAADHADASIDAVIEQVASDFIDLDPRDYGNGYATILAKHAKSIAGAFDLDEDEAAKHIVEIVKRFGDEEAHQDAREAYRAEYDSSADVDVDRKRRQIDDVRQQAPSHIVVRLINGSVEVLDTSRDEDPEALVKTDKVLYESEISDFDPRRAQKSISLFSEPAT